MRRMPVILFLDKVICVKVLSSHISIALLLLNTFIPTALAQTQGVQITGKNTFPLLGGLDLSFINILLAFGALMALPKIPEKNGSITFKTSSRFIP